MRRSNRTAGADSGNGKHSGNGTSRSPQPRQRCAIYTRKSSEEGLDQAFNSLDAQYEACAAFIASQAGLGWKLMPDRYDDGGISGGTMERPSLQRLLQDIRDRKIDVVVVYKIDRLTRSLMDFARIVEIFDASSVSFVSVTQQFNTTTSMGRLTLNVLLSFAQFEREVTAERIRDKIAASRKKGMWMGGTVPLGYRVENRKLVIDETGAEEVRSLFRRYLELRSAVELAREINDALVAETSLPAIDDQADKHVRPRKPMSRGRLYHLLANPVYIGKARHFDQVYDGEHEAIIDPVVFAAVQALLSDKAPNRRSRSNRPDIHLLTGLVYDETGDRLSPTHAYNHGKRYRYYVSKRLRYDPKNREGSWRIAADEFEGIVLQQANDILHNRSMMAGWLQDYAVPAYRIESALSAASKMATTLQEDAVPELRKQILQMIFGKITLSPDRILFEVRKQALIQNLLLSAIGEPVNHLISASEEAEPKGAAGETFAIDRPAAIKRRGLETRIVINGAAREPEASLVDLIARAHLYLARLTDGSVSSIADLSREIGVYRSDISRILPLAFLSPKITDAILSGYQPADLTARNLARLVDVPHLWKDQAKALGM
jgi:DNA invertase Pin-like site-specific DNA recombinase